MKRQISVDHIDLFISFNKRSTDWFQININTTHDGVPVADTQHQAVACREDNTDITQY